jgi:polyphosphate kinase 2
MPRRFDLDDPKLPAWLKDSAMQSGGYPYDKKMDDDEYDDRLKLLQIELVKLQAHLGSTGGKVVAFFEGRDAAGKGGSIDRYLQYLNHRTNRVVALGKPTETEQGQWYFQRHLKHLPTRGEQVLFDRSWYNRAGVEPVMGFCTREQTEAFLDQAPQVERLLVEDGIAFFKFFLDIGREMQMERLHERRHDPLKVWKISPIDVEAIKRFDAYSEARDRMLSRTHTKHAPWTVILTNDQRRARLAAIQTVLTALPYKGKEMDAIGRIDPKIAIPAQKYLRRA